MDKKQVRFHFHTEVSRSSINIFSGVPRGAPYSYRKEIVHLRITFSLFLKASLSAYSLICKWHIIHMQIELIFI